MACVGTSLKRIWQAAARGELPPGDQKPPSWLGYIVIPQYAVLLYLGYFTWKEAVSVYVLTFVSSWAFSVVFELIGGVLLIPFTLVYKKTMRRRAEREVWREPRPSSSPHSAYLPEASPRDAVAHEVPRSPYYLLPERRDQLASMVFHLEPLADLTEPRDHLNSRDLKNLTTLVRYNVRRAQERGITEFEGICDDVGTVVPSWINRDPVRLIVMQMLEEDESS